ncbi:MAG: polymerase subunit alpha, partial [Solirubrobacteraceae bacterium]|nr:polymerase subunit alpha [Solirubrobacteraceae bacterium]
KTCLIVQSVERFSPSQEEIDQARAKSDATAQRRGKTATALSETVHLRVHASALGPALIEDLKHAIEDFPGSAEVVLDIDTSAGTRRLRLGEAFRVQHTPTLRAELEHALAPLPSAATA